MSGAASHPAPRLPGATRHLLRIDQFRIATLDARHYTLSMTSAARRPPRDYFEPDQWPHGTPRPDTPTEVLFAAELANSIRTLAWQRAETLDAGMAQLAAQTGIGKATLRHVADGTRWTSLYFVAKLESAVKRPTTGWLLVYDRQERGEAMYPARNPREQHDQAAGRPPRPRRGAIRSKAPR